MYPVSSSQSGDVQYLALSHSGVRLVRREKSLPTDYLHVSPFMFFFLSVLPSSEIYPCGRTDRAVMPPTLGAALLCSSRASSDMGLYTAGLLLKRVRKRPYKFVRKYAPSRIRSTKAVVTGFQLNAKRMLFLQATMAGLLCLLYLCKF